MEHDDDELSPRNQSEPAGQDSQPADAGGGSDKSEDRSNLPSDAVPVSDDEQTDRSPSEEKVVEEYLSSNVKVLFDGSIHYYPFGKRDESSTIAVEMSYQHLEDRLVLDYPNLKASRLKRALRRVLEAKQIERLNSLAAPLFGTLSPEEELEAEVHWRRLATIFLGTPALNVAKVRQFFWQVKRKHNRQRVERHLMLIVVSQRQGVGKTEFVERLVSPWAECATGPVLITDVIDHRSQDLFRFPIAKVDDMEKVPVAKISVLKSVLSGTRLNRRKLNTMGTVNFLQNSTLIGTANQSIHELIEDDSGHRRFATLEFSSETGSERNTAVWDIVNTTDYVLLWRSVDPAADAPIEPFLDDLAAEQRRGSLETDLLAWLQKIDVNSPEVLAVTTKGGVGATGLYELFVSDTGSAMTQTAFGIKMRIYAKRDDVPFGARRKTSENNIYLFKPTN